MKYTFVEYNLGFGDRMFLTEEEWKTYCRRKPVRYIRKKHSTSCFICGGDTDVANPFQHAHRIGFEIGVICLGLTPDYVDSHDNIVTTHRKGCNQIAELDLSGSMSLLKSKGITRLPEYLPESIIMLWHNIE